MSSAKLLGMKIKMKKYDFSKIEKKWQDKWLEEKIFKAREESKKPKYYQLETFPYPSAAGLHVGHPKGYIAEDIHARYMRMNGYEVLYTMGWDAFGLPTENYAIKIGKSPKEVAASNIKNFKRQVRMFGLSYDWDREINTSSPDYYKWTQWLFIQLFKRGLAYRAKARVNWCPKDQTVLANEQVVSGRCERDNEPVVQKEMEQWFFKITDYVERLLEDLEKLDWPEATKKRQRDWIGKSEGAELDFEIRTKEKPNFVLLHGYRSSPDENFFPWLKKELENRGYRVQAPNLPNSAKPRVEEQVSYVLKNVSFDKNTVLLGHSLGSVVALKTLEKLECRIRKTVLVGGFMENKFVDGDNFEPYVFDWKFDVQKISRNAGVVVSLRDLTDDSVPQYQPKKITEKLGGYLVDFKAEKPHARGSKEPIILKNALDVLTVFTTRPDTLFGATYIVLAPEHPLVAVSKSQVANRDEVENYIEQARYKTELIRQEEAREKTGVELKGVKAINPATKEEIPVWIADYVLAGYGTGAIMAVPAHDQRDYEFAKKFNLPIKIVICPHYPEKTCPVLDRAYEGEGHLVGSGKFDGMKSEEARKAITEFVGGRTKIQYKIRDWSVSRQRYWGVPIPIIYCDKCGVVPVPEKDLPVLLPDDVDYRPKGMPPLASSKKFMETKCPSCGGSAKRDPETLDTFVDSSWYYLRYTDPHNDKEFASRENLRHWLPVDLYIIGAEHTALHLLYSRFITKFLYDEGYLNFNEPFLKVRHQGMILGPDGRRMSKRWGNVVNPDDVISEFGADTMRLYEMFMGPFEGTQPWDSKGILGVHRFLNNVWDYFKGWQKDFEKGKIGEKQDVKIERLLQKTIRKVSEDIKEFRFNTAISALMIFFNSIKVSGKETAYGLSETLPLTVKNMEKFLKLLYPFAPHLAQELWSMLGNDKILDYEKWPEYDSKLAEEEKITLVVQVNGKVRDTFEAEADISEEKAKEIALGRKKVKSFLLGKEPKRVIYVKGKLVSIVA